MLLVLIYSRGRNGERLGMGTPSLVHPDFRPGVCGVPSDEGTFAPWDQASSPLPPAR